MWQLSLQNPGEFLEFFGSDSTCLFTFATKWPYIIEVERLSGPHDNKFRIQRRVGYTKRIEVGTFNTKEELVAIARLIMASEEPTYENRSQ